MNFGSNFVLDDSNAVGEVVEEGLLAVPQFQAATPVSLPVALPTATDHAAGGADAQPGAPAALAAPVPRFQQRTFVRKIDTNVLNIDFESLRHVVTVATGEPQLCQGCTACLNAFSVLTSASSASKAAAAAGGAAGGDGGSGGMDGLYEWKCEFCGTDNRLDLDEMEKPRSDQTSVEFVLEAPPRPADDRGGGGSSGDAGAGRAVLFCIDTSGSMCSTTEVQGRFSLRGNRTGQLAALRVAGDAAEQRWGQQRRDVTYVSRMQAVQAAVGAELDRLAHEQPATRVGIVSFSEDVILTGDAAAEPRVLAGDRLIDFAVLTEVGGSYPLTRPIGEAATALKERLFALEESGATALGPAVTAALAMLKRAGGAGRLIVCTDGLANVGIGALDVNPPADGGAEPGAFYEQLGSLATEAGIVIDVVTVDGDGCDVESVGAMSEATHGAVTRVDPLTLVSKYGGMLTTPLLATNVSVRLLLHAALRFRDSSLAPAAAAATAPAAAATPAAAAAAPAAAAMERHVGNATSETELSLEFELCPAAERARFDGTMRMPFQTQIRYARPDGTRCLRIITAVKELTQDRTVAERNANVPVLASYAINQASGLARDGAYMSSRVNMRAWDNLVGRTAAVVGTDEARSAVAEYRRDVAQLDTHLGTAQAAEYAVGGATASAAAAEDADGAADAGLSRARKVARSRNDGFSRTSYTFYGKGSKGYR